MEVAMDQIEYCAADVNFDCNTPKEVASLVLYARIFSSNKNSNLLFGIYVVEPDHDFETSLAWLLRNPI